MAVPKFILVGILLVGQSVRTMAEQKRVLVVAPNSDFIRSHFSFSLNLAHVLAERHIVHIVVPISEESDRIEELERKFHIRYFVPSRELCEEKAKMRALGPPGPPPSEGGAPPLPQGPNPGARMPAIMGKMYLEMASDAKLMAELRAQHFDVGLAEAFMANEWSLALFRLLGIRRSVVTTAMPPTPDLYYFFGLLPRIRDANIPSIRGTKIGDHDESRREARREEIWQNNQQYVERYVQGTIENDVAFADIASRLYGMEHFPLLAELFRQVDAYLVNTQPEIDFCPTVRAVQSLPDNRLHYVGGANAMRVREQQNNNLAVDEIMRRLEHKRGMVLFSLGTVKQTTTSLQDEKYEAIKEAMRHFPDHLFVWKLTKGDPRIEQLRAQMPNVYATDWMDQPAILAHPKTVAFISHCGMNSVLEATWNGVPLVAVPLMGDQFYNSEALASKRLAVVLDFYGAAFSADALANALDQVLNPSKQSETSISLSEVKKLALKLRNKNLRAEITNAVVGK